MKNKLGIIVDKVENEVLLNNYCCEFLNHYKNPNVDMYILPYIHHMQN